MSATATKRYAQAFFDLSFEAKKLDAVQSDFKKIAELIRASPALSEFLTNPLIPPHKRREIIDAIFKKWANELTLRAVLFLSEKKRLKHLAGICNAFEQLYLDHQGVIKMDIASGVALNDRQANEITRHLKAQFGKEVRSSTTVDPDLIGGIMLRQGNTIYDFSFRAQLERIRKKIITA